jgi:hypothetical protein
LFVVVVDHFYDLFYNAIITGGADNVAALVVEMVFFSLCAAFVIGVYFGYYRKKYNARVKDDPKAQQKMNYEFRTLDG